MNLFYVTLSDSVHLYDLLFITVQKYYTPSFRIICNNFEFVRIASFILFSHFEFLRLASGILASNENFGINSPLQMSSLYAN